MKQIKKRKWDMLHEILGDEKLVGAEIGVYEGINADHLLSLMPNLKLYLVDRWEVYNKEERKGDLREEGVNAKNHMVMEREEEFWEEKYNLAREVAKKYGDRAIILKGDSSEQAEWVPELDFVFIDGDHSYEGCYKDITVWRKKVKKGGLILGHDYDTRIGVRKALADLYGSDIILYESYIWGVVND